MPLRVLIVILVVIAAALPLARPAHAEARMALLIGNQSYTPKVGPPRTRTTMSNWSAHR